MSDNVERHASICKMLNEMYQKKNHDYGDSFHLSYLEEGMAMPRIRLSDKLNRFKMLSKKPDAQMVNDESIKDTLLDLANYVIMTLMELGEGSANTKKLIKYKGAIMNLVYSDGEFSIDSSYCSVCNVCCHDNKGGDEEPCKGCAHNCGHDENFILDESKVEVLR